jgi:hypothetical protein
VPSPLDDLSLPATVRETLEIGLAEDEVLFWAACPAPQRLMRLGLPAFFFAIPWTAFALVWTALASGIANWGGAGWKGKPVNICGGLWGLPFIGVGFWTLSTPWRLLWRARRTVYAVTNRRALIVTRGHSTQVRSFSLLALSNIRCEIRANGSGDLIFDAAPAESKMQPKVEDHRGFFGIQDPKGVEELIRALAAQSISKSLPPEPA